MNLAARLATLGAAAATLYQFEAYGVIAALPNISNDLGLSPSTAAWVPATYLITATGGLVSVGTLAGQTGYRSLFSIALALLGLGALVCAVTPGSTILIAGRAAQGFGGGMLAATAYSMIGALAPECQRRAILGWLAAGAGLGMILGAPIGGWMAERFSWRALFIMLAVLTLPALACLARAPNHPSSAPVAVPGWAGTLALGLGAASLGTGATLADIAGLAEVTTLAAIGFGLAALVFFAWRERAGPRPMFPRRVWANPTLWRAWLTLFAGIMALGGTTFLLPFHLQNDLGLSPAGAGTFLLTLTGAYAAASLLQARVAARTPEVLQTVPGFILAGAGAGSLASVPAGIPAAVLACTAVGFGIGWALPAVNDAVVGSLDQADRPRGSTLIPLGINFGGVAGVLASGMAVHVSDNGIAILGPAAHLFKAAFWVPTTALGTGSILALMRVARR
ncbi:MAG: MFS transporter [Candidatus Methylacidiphilales bacterium]